MLSDAAKGQNVTQVRVATTVVIEIILSPLPESLQQFPAVINFSYFNAMIRLFHSLDVAGSYCRIDLTSSVAMLLGRKIDSEADKTIIVCIFSILT